jgi:hypothetical protein
MLAGICAAKSYGMFKNKQKKSRTHNILVPGIMATHNILQPFLWQALECSENFISHNQTRKNPPPNP